MASGFGRLGFLEADNVLGHEINATGFVWVPYPADRGPPGWLVIMDGRCTDAASMSVGGLGWGEGGARDDERGPGQRRRRGQAREGPGRKETETESGGEGREGANSRVGLLC